MLLGEDEWAAGVEGRLTMVMMVDVEGLNWRSELDERERESVGFWFLEREATERPRRKKMKMTGDAGALLKKIA